MRERAKTFWSTVLEENSLGGFLCFIAAAILLIGSFFAPPVGEITSSALVGASEIFAFFVVFQIGPIIRTAQKYNTKLTYKRGETEVSAEANSDED